MLQLRTTINGEIKYLDLYGNEDIQLEVSFNEVQDITSKNSPFSKSFKLPGSKGNNDAFNHFYDFNSSTFDYDVKEKFPASLMFNGYDLYNGYLRLNSVSRTNTSITYDVTFYSQVGDLVSSIQDKYLSDLDYSDMIGDWPPNRIESINPYFDPDLRSELQTDSDPKLNGKVYYSLLNRGYDYFNNLETGIAEFNELNIPRINWGYPPTQNAYGYFDYNDPLGVLQKRAAGAGQNYPFVDLLSVPTEYLTPSLRVKELYEKIFEENGYTITSDFFDTAYFKKYYLPLTFGNDGFYPVQTDPPRLIFSGDSGSSGTSVTELTAYTWNGNGTLTQPLKRFGTDNTFLDTDNFTTGLSVDRFNLREGFYNWEFKYSLNAQDTDNFRFWLHNRDDSQPDAVPFTRGGYIYVSDWYSATTGNVYEEEIVQGQMNLTGLDFSSQVGFSVEFSASSSSDLRFYKFEFNILDGVRSTSGGTLDPALEMPEPNIKQIDFISSINKVFNLMVVPDPDNPTNLLVEPVIDYLGRGDQLDWTDKVDRDTPITIQPLDTIFNGTLDYTYTEDKGSANTTFKALNDRNFGQNIVSLDTDYRDKVTKFDNIFSAQVDEPLSTDKGINGFTLPSYYVSKVNNKDGSTFTEFRPYKTTPKLLFRNAEVGIDTFRTYAMFNSYPFFYLGETQKRTWNSNNRFTTYPFGVSGLTHGVVWYGKDTFDTNEYDLYNRYEDLYDVYYKDYVLDLTNREQRIIKGKFYLTPEEVKGLKFNEKIFLDGGIWRVNKISGLSLTKPGLCDVELIKITRTYTKHRVRYYDLINCTGGTDLHTSTDLNYGVYALEGGFVDVDGECYQVSASTYDSGYTYSVLNIDSLFTDCNCDTRDYDYDWYDDLAITPTPTPSSTPTFCVECTYYEWENESPYYSYVIYRDCTTGDLVNASIGGGQVYTACTCDNYTIIRGSGVRINFEEECSPPITPTPTPTPNQSQTPTPTPSFTPNACYEYDVSNQNPYSVQVTYTDCCTGEVTQFTLPGDTSGPVCSTTTPTGSIVVDSQTYPCSSPCPSPTPTPTLSTTPSITPSPSPSGSEPLIYEVENCDDPGDRRIISSPNFYSPGKVIKITANPSLCFEVIGFTTGTPVDQQTGLDYTDCGSCPR